MVPGVCREGATREPRLFSAVVPVLNEEANLVSLYERLAKAVSSLPCRSEFIFVDDGSTDGSERVLRGLHERDPRVKVLFFTRNFGHERALTAGLDMAQGDAVVILDADLQDPPEVMLRLLEKWREGYDIVSARRVRRLGDTRSKRALAYLFYRVMRRLTPWDMPADTGNFCLMDRQVVHAFRRCREWNRFVRVLVTWTGFRATTVDFERHPRHAGKSKYSLRKQFGLAVTSVTSFSLLPLRLAALFGITAMAAAVVAAVVLGLRALNGTAVSFESCLLVSLWFLGGVQCLFIGIVGEYVGRALMETQRRPLYFLRETLGFEGPKPDHESVSAFPYRWPERD